VSCLLCSARGPGRYAALGTAERLGLPCLCFAHDPLKSDLATAELLRYTALVTFEAPVYESMRERGLPEERLHLWPRPVRVADLQPAPTEVFRVLHLGRLSRLKAQSALALIAATPDLAQAIPGLEIVIVGGGGKGRLVAQAAAAMNERCGRQVVRCTGPSLDPLGCIEQSNLVVAGGYSALEALYNGRPAILSGFGWLGPATAASVPEAVNLHFADRSPARSNPGLVTASVITVYNALRSESEGREYLPSRSWFPQDHTPDHGAQLLERLAQQLTQAVPFTGGEGR